MWTENIKEMGQLAETNRKDYCSQHGYTWRCCYQSMDTSRHPVWTKLLWLLQLMDEYEAGCWIQWTDADSLVINPEIRLEQLIGLVTPEVNFIATKDRWTGFNCGQFLIRICEWSKQLLYNAYHKYPDCLSHKCREQESMRRELSKYVEEVG